MQRHLPAALVFATAVLAMAGCGKSPETAAPAPAPAAATTPAPAPAVAENSAGKSVYGKVCAMCHSSGAAGAPKPGDRADWEPRIAQGMDTLFKHAIEGYEGKKGVMPPRGSGTTLSDDEIKAAVEFMVAQSR